MTNRALTASFFYVALAAVALGALFKANESAADTLDWLIRPAFVFELSTYMMIAAAAGLALGVGVVLICILTGDCFDKFALTPFALLAIYYLYFYFRIALGPDDGGANLVAAAFSIALCGMFGFSAASRRLSYQLSPVIVLDTIAISAFVFLATNVYVLISQPEMAIGFGRFYGTTDHPNFIGMIGALSLVLGYCLVSYRRGSSQAAVWLAYLPLLALALVVVVLSGSRTALFTSVIGVAARSFRKTSLTAVIGAIALLAAVTVVLFLAVDDLKATIPFLDIERVTSSDDTRSDAWRVLLDAFQSAPIFGIGTRLDVSENSYLRILATEGLVGLGLFLIPPLQVIVQLLLDRHRRLVASGYLWNFGVPLAAATFAGSMLEGFMMEAFSFPVILFLTQLFLLELDSRSTNPTAFGAIRNRRLSPVRRFFPTTSVHFSNDDPQA